MKTRIDRWGGAAGAAALALAVWTGCDVGSPDEVYRETGIIVSGYYAGQADGRLTTENSGAPVTSMDVLQDGDQLQGVDNNGNIFRGSISSASEATARFQMEGSTTAGAAVTIAGSFDVSGTTSTMRGTWVEDALYGSVYATATVPTNAPNGGGLTINPSGSIALAVGSSRQFSASGGTGNYTWTRSNTEIGTLAGSGSSVTYAATAAGTQTITLSDGSSTRMTTVTQQ